LLYLIRLGRTPLDEGSARRRPLPDDILAAGGIGNPQSQAGNGLTLRSECVRVVSEIVMWPCAVCDTVDIGNVLLLQVG
jgi:hypothetical protein